MCGDRLIHCRLYRGEALRPEHRWEAALPPKLLNDNEISEVPVDEQTASVEPNGALAGLSIDV